jgi:DNA-binding winged helix-turn-helix (wHTH) protein
VEPVLTVRLGAQLIILFGKQTALPERSFRLIVLLAKAAGGRVVTQRQIEKGLWSTVVDPRAVADAVRDLRKHVKPMLPPYLAADTFIANRPREGYVLSLNADQVRIDP